VNASQRNLPEKAGLVRNKLSRVQAITTFRFESDIHLREIAEVLRSHSPIWRDNLVEGRLPPKVTALVHRLERFSNHGDDVPLVEITLSLASEWKVHGVVRDPANQPAASKQTAVVPWPSDLKEWWHGLDDIIVDVLHP
jgi:hypothetical protein